MSIRRGKIAAAVAVVATSAAVAGAVYAAGESKDEVALKPARTPASQDVERRVNTLLSMMTTVE